MTIAAPAIPLPAPFRPKQRLDFNTRVSFNDDAGPAQGLRDGIELFKAAERLGTTCRHRFRSSPRPASIPGISRSARLLSRCATRTPSCSPRRPARPTF